MIAKAGATNRQPSTPQNSLMTLDHRLDFGRLRIPYQVSAHSVSDPRLTGMQFHFPLPLILRPGPVTPDHPLQLCRVL
jgi:hypothetical protein